MLSIMIRLSKKKIVTFGFQVKLAMKMRDDDKKKNRPKHPTAGVSIKFAKREREDDMESIQSEPEDPFSGNGREDPLAQGKEEKHTSDPKNIKDLDR